MWCHFCLIPALVSRQRKHQDTQPRAHPPSQHQSPVSTTMPKDGVVSCISDELPDLAVPSPRCPCPVRCISLSCSFHLSLRVPANTANPMLCVRHASPRTTQPLVTPCSLEKTACCIFQSHGPISSARFHSNCRAEPPGLRGAFAAAFIQGAAHFQL